MRPWTGARLTWQSKTDMKIDTRCNGAMPRPSSGGGAAKPAKLTTPSAGDMTRSARTGVTRAGSRKKYAHHKVATRPSQPSGAHIHHRMSVATAKPKTNV